MRNLYVLTIISKPRAGHRKPIETRYGVVADSKDEAREKFVAQYEAQIIETDVVTVTCYEDGICRIA
jgi:hypothetical protein